MSLDLANSCNKSIQLTRYQGFPGGSGGKESTCNAGDLGSIPGSGRSSGDGNGYPLQYSCLENPMDREAWWATIHRVANSGTRLKWLSLHTWLIIFCEKCHKKRNQRIILKKSFQLEIWWIVATWVGVQNPSIRRERGWSDGWRPCSLLPPAPCIRFIMCYRQRLALERMHRASSWGHESCWGPRGWSWKPPTFKFQMWAVEEPSTSGCGCKEGAGRGWEDWVGARIFWQHPDGTPDSRQGKVPKLHNIPCMISPGRIWVQKHTDKWVNLSHYFHNFCLSKGYTYIGSYAIKTILTS